MILKKIANKTIERYAVIKSNRSFEEVKTAAQSLQNPAPFAFEKALKHKDISFICEVKKASPSKGIISEGFPFETIAADYAKHGASAISVLTEPHYFLGSDSTLSRVKDITGIPVLRKDFTVDAYQIYEAALIGADAVLLICALLDTATVAEYIRIADSLGLSCLVEAHTEAEISSAVRAGARVVGVNNRNLNTFAVDLENCVKLRKRVPPGITYVAESGIRTPQDVAHLRENGVDAVLIGEALMKSQNIGEALKALRQGR